MSDNAWIEGWVLDGVHNVGIKVNWNKQEGT